MNEPEDTLPPDEPDEIAGEWMDGEPSETREIAYPVDDRQRHRLASLQLVHALLSHLAESEPAGRQTRLDRAIQAVRESSGDTSRTPPRIRPQERRRSRLRLLAPWIVAASALVAVGVWLSTSPSSSALASLDRVVQAMDNPVDRTYEITVDGDEGQDDQPPPREPGPKPRPKPPKRDRDDPPPPPDDHPPPPDDRRPPPDDRPPAPRRDDAPRPADRRPGLNGAILYARSGRQFVLVRAAPGGKTVINGSNGIENWLVRPDKPVLVSSDPGEFRIPMPENLAMIPLVDLRSSLISLRHGYRLEELPAETLEGDATTLWRRLRATKLDAATKGPRTVWLWYHSTTNLLRHVRFDGIHLQGRPEPRQMTIRLVSTAHLPTNWFEHASHHTANAPVERVEP